jgi:hypothetical protein
LEAFGRAGACFRGRSSRFVVARPRTRGKPPDANTRGLGHHTGFGSQIASQFNLLAKNLPQSLTQLAREFGSSSWGAWLLGHAQDINLGNATGPVASYIAALFGSVFRTAAYIAVLLFAALYFAVQSLDPSQVKSQTNEQTLSLFQPQTAVKNAGKSS